jgi:hypothetical protein
VIEFRSILLLVLLAVFQSASAQFEYFNQVMGESGDMNVQSHENIERIENNYVLWGGGIEFDTVYYDYLKLDETGSIIASSEFRFPYEFLYTGVTTSFSKIPLEEAFLMSHAKEDTISMKGFLMKLDSNLDTLWTREYDFFPFHTYFYTHAWDEDGFVLAGEFRNNGQQQTGTFIAKVDLEGELLWYEVLHEPNTGGFRNHVISVLDSGYLTSGSYFSDNLSEGITEYISPSGELQWSVEGEGGIIRGIMKHIVKSNGDIIVSQTIGLEEIPDASSPAWSYFKIRLSELDTVSESFSAQHDLFESELMIAGGVTKMLEIDDSALIIAGNHHKLIGGELHDLAFISRVNSDFSIEWYTEFSYDPCSTCKNVIYDMELAPDGGFTMVGAFSDQAADPYDKTWLVKVDACGDLEWQGCEPVGIQGWEIQDSKLEIFPNPVSGNEINLRFPQEVMVEKVLMVDALGRISNSLFLISDSGTNKKFEIQKSEMAAGLYTIIVTSKDGSVYSEKVVVE